MGKVFTWEDVVEKRVPNKNDFPHVCTQIQKVFRQSPAIRNAVLFGSVVRGDFNIRSDIDVFYQYRSEYAKESARVTNELAVMAKKFHIDINFEPCCTRIANTSMHFFGPLFVRHLNKSVQEGGLIKGGEPVLAPTVLIPSETESYMRARAHSLDEARTKISVATEGEVAKLLKKTLETPTQAARKMLEYHGRVCGDSKRNVVERYRSEFPKGLSEELNRLVSIDTQYTVVLENQLTNPNEDRYCEMLSQLLEEVTSVLDFLYGNIEYLTRR